MSKVFVIDVSRCSGCYNCQLSCKDEHCGNDWTPYAKPQPQIGQFWVKVHEHVEGTIPKVKIHYTSQLCNHCDNPICMKACGQGAITKRKDGLVLIDPEKCTGCEACMKACPYDVIYKNEELGICQKCTGCTHLLDNGAKLPRCVEACPTDALKFGEKEDFGDILKTAAVLKPEAGTRPNVYYLNLPGKFIGGTVYDPDEQEVIIGANVTARCGEKTYTAVTDDFGDFWFKKLTVDTYDVTIECDGYETKEFKNILTENSVNLGDIPLKKVKK
jgi:tetrathionate reductase subunit B